MVLDISSSNNDPSPKCLWFTPDPIGFIFRFSLHHHKPGFGNWKFHFQGLHAIMISGSSVKSA